MNKFQDMIEYLNKNYNAKTVLKETKDCFCIYTKHSSWFIYKDDKKRFNKFTLYHRNYKAPLNSMKRINHGWHVQLRSGNLGYCIYRAAIHDLKRYVPEYHQLVEKVNESICRY